MPAPSAHELEIAELRARVAALEQALERRSQELRQLQQLACLDDLLKIDQLCTQSGRGSGLGFDPSSWQESHRMQPSDAEETLRQLWRSLADAESANGA